MVNKSSKNNTVILHEKQPNHLVNLQNNGNTLISSNEKSKNILVNLKNIYTKNNIFGNSNPFRNRLREIKEKKKIITIKNNNNIFSLQNIYPEKESLRKNNPNILSQNSKQVLIRQNNVRQNNASIVTQELQKEIKTIRKPLIHKENSEETIKQNILNNFTNMNPQEYFNRTTKRQNANVISQNSQQVLIRQNNTSKELQKEITIRKPLKPLIHKENSKKTIKQYGLNNFTNMNSQEYFNRTKRTYNKISRNTKSKREKLNNLLSSISNNFQ